MAAYTTPAQIGAYLGVTLTPEQTTAAEQLAVTVTEFIDHYTARSWQAASPVVGELANVLLGGWHPGGWSVVYLAARPVATVDAVRLRTPFPNETETVLGADEYELIDPVAGVVSLVGAGTPYAVYPHLLAVVDYTHAGAVPAGITLAATMIAAGELSRIMALGRGSQLIEQNPALSGLESVSVGQNEVSVKLASTVTGSAASATSAKDSGWATPGSAVASILNGYRRVVIA